VQPATGATTTQVSALGYDPELLQEPARRITAGFADSLDDLASTLDVAVSSAVTRIAYDDRRVSLRLDSGESLTVDRAVVTVPLGVLKTDTLQFSPPLPLLHQRAISQLGMGVVDVVWLRFDVPFWRADASAAPGSEPGDILTPANVLTIVGGAGVIAEWIDPGSDTDAETGSDTDTGAVLVGVIAAAQARRLESLDDDEFQTAILADLAPYATAPG
jgi:monoamine oxidase